jgi:hypothetical protein
LALLGPSRISFDFLAHLMFPDWVINIHSMMRERTIRIWIWFFDLADNQS